MTAPVAPIPTTEIPMSFRIRGGKTVMVLPDGSRAVARREATVDNTMVNVLARGFRWQRLLYDGTYATIEDMAAAEKINPSYIARVLRLTLLAPDIVEAILDGRQPAELQLDNLLEGFPLEWEKQRKSISGSIECGRR